MDKFESLAGVEVEPDAFDLALHIVADMSDEEMEEHDLIDVASTAFIEWSGVIGDDMSARDIGTVHTLHARLLALFRLVDADADTHLMPVSGGDAARRAVAEAACFSKLCEEDGEPAFRLADFVSRSQGAPLQ